MRSVIFFPGPSPHIKTLQFAPPLVLESAGPRATESRAAAPRDLPRNWNVSKPLRRHARSVKRAVTFGFAAAGIEVHNHARGHFHRIRRTDRRPLSPGAPEECADRHHPAPASAIRGHDEPPDHLSALLRLRAP